MKKEPVNIVVGMQVYSAAHLPMGTVEHVFTDGFQVNGERLPLNAIAKTDTGSVYLNGPAMARYYREATEEAGATQVGPKAPERPTFGPEQIQAGTEVYGIDDQHVGQVKATNQDTFLVNRLLHRDLFIPYSAVLDASDTRVILDISAHEVNKMHWQEPKIETGSQIGSMPVRTDEVTKKDEG